MEELKLAKISELNLVTWTDPEVHPIKYKGWGSVYVSFCWRSRSPFATNYTVHLRMRKGWKKYSAYSMERPSETWPTNLCQSANAIPCNPESKPFPIISRFCK